MDLLSEALSLLNTRSSLFAGLKAGGDWAIDFPPPEGVKFNAILEGSCWLMVEGVEQAIRLTAGDCFLLPRKRAFSLRSDLSLPAIHSDEIYRHAVNGVAICGTAEEFFLIGGRFDFGEQARLLLDGLPAVAVIKSGSDQASVLDWALRRMAHELTNPSLGSSIVVQHLGHIMLVQVLRMYSIQEGNSAPSWLVAISDPRIGATIQAIHADPARSWTVENLAKIAGVSRSTFALRFKQKSGVPPLEYVLRWRMQLAARFLNTNNHVTVSSTAQKLGYDSDSAFSHAFKRVMGCSPREYRERAASTS
ncbi:AraC family transcriptional regulator [Pseudomonas sp. P867]|uniref:AraC family transcriptional regulator n=1 Tax=Pseudomonas sp. P867 TaxID=2816050 RepID=UPI001CA6F761|nr:AraC family transcriptional regulator [Pseudomonas sp. P867]MBY8972765.1 AraC family transcriptional regulator [Pseudomonas sp. P867]